MRKKSIKIISIIFALLILNPTVVFAGVNEEIGSALGNITGWIGDVFFNIIVDIADGLAKVLKESQLSIDHLMSDTSILSFKMIQNNQFSDNALKIYEILAEIVLIFMVSLFVIIGIRFMLARTKQQFDIAKNYTKTFIVSLFALFLSISFLRYTFEFRTIIINVINNAFWSAPQQSIAERFRYELIEFPSKSLVNAGLYLGFQFITLWFAFSYAGISFALVILIALLPIMILSMNSNKFKRMFDNWVSEFLSAFIVPVVDVILFNIVLLIIPNSTSLVKLIFIGMIMPTRNLARKLMGANGGAMEGSSIGLLLGATNLARNIAHTTVAAGTSTIGGIKEGNEMKKTGEFYAQQPPLTTTESGFSGISGGPSYTTSNEYAQLAIATGNKDMLTGLSNSDKALAYTQMGQDKKKRAIIKGVTQAASSGLGMMAGAGMGAWFGPSGLVSGASIGADLGLAASPMLEKMIDTGVEAFKIAEPLVTPRIAPYINPIITPIRNAASNVYSGATSTMDAIKFAYDSALVSPYKKAIDNALLDTSSEEFAKYTKSSTEPFTKTNNDVSLIASNLYTKTFGKAPTPEVQANLTAQIQTMLKTDDNAFYKKSQLESLNGLKDFYKNSIISKVGKPVEHLDDILNSEFNFDNEISRLKSELSVLPTTLHLAGGEGNPTLGTINSGDLTMLINSLSTTFSDSSTPEYAKLQSIKDVSIGNQVNTLKSSIMGLYQLNFGSIPTPKIQAKLDSQVYDLCSGAKGPNIYTKQIDKDILNNTKNLYMNSLNSRISSPIADIENILDTTFKFDEQISSLEKELLVMSRNINITGTAGNPTIKIL